ncbi:hypothetical protein KUTeg_024059 [Tegillarca granosa]|uniref:CS domain-containing protein n=1 Tax=Tegillarca granosa TaxID=220873 RepID=A0ABQ9DW94_TEGGR|nr:hypothetical protein KUTeg_024059 [Tegillarca granosa]
MADFDERSGIVPSKTDWGLWWQTVDEIHIEVNVPPGSSSKDISCQIKSNYLKVTVKGNQIIENPGFDFSGASVSGNYHGGGPDLPS